MKKKDWIIIAGILVLAVVFDQVLKELAEVALKNNSIKIGPLGFTVQETPFVLMDQLNILGYISAISPFGFSVFFLLLLFVLNLILVQRLMGLRIGVTLFVAGMMGESLDIMFRGGVLDWMTFFKMYFNLSDVLIFVGVIMTLFFAVKDRSLIIQKHNLRRKMFIEKEQYTFCYQVLFPYFLFAFAYCIFSVSFIKIVINRFVEISPVLQSNIITIFLLLFFILSMCFLLIVLGFTIYLSNKIYGPVYAFKKYIKEVLLCDGEDRPFKVRKGDHFMDLPDLAQQINAKYYKGKNKGKK